MRDIAFQTNVLKSQYYLKFNILIGIQCGSDGLFLSLEEVTLVR